MSSLPILYVNRLKANMRETGTPLGGEMRDQIAAHFSEVEKVVSIDELRVEFSDDFGLARSSNPTPPMVMRFEAETHAALAKIQAAFKRAILRTKTEAQLPY